MQPRLELVLFDMAGTTIVDKGQVPKAFMQALEAHGFSVTEDELRAVRGASKREAIRLLLDQRRGDNRSDNPILAGQLYAVFRDRLLEGYRTEGVRFIDGTLNTFAWLRNRGVKVVLNTGFDRVITNTIVEHLAWQGEAAETVLCGDEVQLGRPAPYLIFHAMERTGVIDVQQVMNVGDTVRDLRAGYHAGVGFNVGVLSGAHSIEQLREEPHTHLIPSVAELPALLENELFFS